MTHVQKPDSPVRSASTIGKKMPIQPSDGTARPMFATQITTAAPRPVCPIASPAGSATASAMPSDTALSTTCSSSRTPDAVGAAPAGRIGQPRDGLAQHLHRV